MQKIEHHIAELEDLLYKKDKNQTIINIVYFIISLVKDE